MKKKTPPLEIKFSEGSDYRISSTVQLFNKKGNKSFLNGEYSQALRYYVKGIKFSPEIGLLYFNAGLCLVKLNRMGEAK